MASDWLAAVLPANQMPGLKIFVNYSNLATQAPEVTLRHVVNEHLSVYVLAFIKTNATMYTCVSIIKEYHVAS